MNRYGFAADSILILHFAYLLFTVGGALAVLAGGILRWAWIRRRIFRIIHLFSVLFVAVEALIGMWCPLTLWEYDLRKLAGQRVEEEIPLVARIIRSIMFYDFSPLFFLFLYLGFAAVVFLLFIFIPPEKSAKKRIEVDRRPDNH